MKTGIYKKKHTVRVYDNGDEFIVQFENGTSITMSDVSEIEFKKD